MKRQFLAWSALAVLSALAAGCTIGSVGKSSGPVTVKACGVEGVEAALAAAKGKVVLMDCWATWCGPCVASFPKLVDKHEKFADRGLAVISLSLDEQDKASSVLSFLQKNRASFTNLHFQRDAAAKKWMEERLAYEGGIPHAVVFDKTGKRVWAGHPMADDLTRTIEAELAK